MGFLLIIALVFFLRVFESSSLRVTLGYVGVAKEQRPGVGRARFALLMDGVGREGRAWWRDCFFWQVEQYKSGFED